LEGVTIAKVDSNRKPIPETKTYIPCDTLLLSVGLIPENELSKTANIALSPVTGGAITDQNRETSSDGIFACGNVLHVHDLVDYVSDEAEIAGRGAAQYLSGNLVKDTDIKVTVDGKVRYCVPQHITYVADTKLYFRVSDVYKNAKLKIYSGSEEVYTKKYLKLAPGEMETVTVGEKMLSDASEIRLELEI
ncbi:MAG: FAD-dependent oxidoreductase, partial [Clostridia bacterium]|nr:FAD-dependent oxidoreductase [Clostridia bacterium]